MKAGKKYRAYSQAALTDAYNAVKTENVSVCRASKILVFQNKLSETGSRA